MSGWYRLHRGWQDHAVFRSEPLCRRAAFVWLIEHANFEASDIRLPVGVVRLERGQLAHSLRYIAEAWKWPEAKVRRFLTSLQASKIIDAATDAGRTVLTICNYDKYQTRERVTDAPVDARLTHDRRVGDAKSKEGKEREEEKGRAPARSRGGSYAFAGETIRLNAKDLATWSTTYSAIPDIRAELASIDVWFSGQDDETRREWFRRTPRMLNTKHQQMLAKGCQAQPGAAIHSIDDAFMRRLERFKAGQGQ